MLREISAGAVVVRKGPGGWEVAVIEPQREGDLTAKSDKKRQKQVLALPKGIVDPDEKPEETAMREVRIRVDLHKQVGWQWPFAETDSHWYTLGMDPDLNEALRIALRNTLDFLEYRAGLTRLERLTRSNQRCGSR